MKDAVTLGLTLLALFAGCAGGSAPGGRSATDVASSHMAETFAGKNRCDPKAHDRPFVIEWDATDSGSFEARAATDVIFVRYEGCGLKVIDGCVDGSVPGSLGSYRPVEWTSGSVESLDVNDEGELYAKLPLAAATLGGRVQGGEKFHMEYFVSGTRTATRDSVARADLARIPACRSATHYVYAYNLGAFALGAQSSLKGEAGGTMWGAGASVSRATESKAEKRGGDLSKCRGDSARELKDCTAPIRLTLREITGDLSADATDSAAPETDGARNLAGRLQATTAREKEAEEHARTADTKLASRDGAGCLTELDRHDQLDPRPSGMSTNAAAALASTRARCLMLAGQCPAGKALFRQSLEQSQGATLGPAQLDAKTDDAATQHCQGGTMSPRDQFLKAGADLETGAYKEREDAAYCMAAYTTYKKLVSTVKPKDEDDPVKFVGANVRTNAPLCLARAGDCARAFTVFVEAWNLDPLMPAQSKLIDAEGKRNVFESIMNGKCRAP